MILIDLKQNRKYIDDLKQTSLKSNLHLVYLMKRGQTDEEKDRVAYRWTNKYTDMIHR